MSAAISSPFVILGVFWVAGVVAVLVTIYLLAAKVRRRNQTWRPNGISIVHDPADAKFEIIAVHGLGAHPIHTWEGKPSTNSHTKLHLLHDLLGKDFPTARILSFAYNSDWLVDAPEKTAQQIGKRLLEGLIKHRGDSQRLPIIFLGHSFGGIVIKEALCASDRSSILLKDTCGIIFLGTPHQGSSLSTAGALLSQFTGFLGSNAALLLALRSRGSQLSDLERSFRHAIGEAKLERKIVSFYETRPTFMLGWLSVGLVVDRDSATGYSADPTEIDADHSGLNKFKSSEHPGYKALKGAIGKLRAKPLVDQADEYIREERYTKTALEIKRLSGDLLSMDQCYINLLIVEHINRGISVGNRSEGNDSAPQPSPFSLFARQKVEMPTKEAQVQLADIFNQRKRPNNTMFSPRRILIRGRAGVGKTTLCKKMVHEFVKKQIWSKLFDRVLWVPLRKLKQRNGSGYNLKALFDDEFFRFSKKGTKEDGTRFAEELYKALDHNRTLFILDGWDEVAGIDENDDMFDFLRELFKQSNVIITSRPSAALPYGIEVDLELETIGFSPMQVDEYINKAHGENADELKVFLRSRELVRGLVRIPIQLDAFCYCWNDIVNGRKEDPRTMTTLYQAIQTSLWRKDAVRLKKDTAESLRGASQKYIESLFENELRFLEHLAFTGLVADKIEFNQDDRNKVHDNFFKPPFSLNQTLPYLSFLRTSDPSAKPKDQLYHFIHLTFQEYFAARYFARHWTKGQNMEYTLFEQERTKAISPLDFLQEHKYDAGYDIMWRFVAGILDSADKRQTTRFFEEIEKEPVDLLGPTHQRLVMHCLSEAVSLPDEIRTSREGRLAAWLLFEYDYTGSSTFTRDPELPDKVLQDVLSGSKKKTTLLRALANSERFLSESIISILGDLSKDEYNDKYFFATQVIAKQSTLSETAVATLVELIKDRENPAQGIAIEAAGQQSSLPETVVTALVELIKNNEFHMRYNAVESIKNQLVLSDTIIAALLELLNDEDKSIRCSATEAMSMQSALSEITIVALIELLKDQDYIVQRFAAEAIRHQSALSETTTATLIELFKDEDSTVRYYAFEAIGNQSALSDTAIAALVELFKDEDSIVRYYAFEAIGNQSALSDTAIAALIELFKDEDSTVRYYAAHALGNRSALSETAIIALIELLKDEDSTVRRSVAHALGNQSALSETAIAALIELFKNEDSTVRRSAANAIGLQSGLLETTTMTALIELFKDEDYTVRRSAAIAIGNQSGLLEVTTITALIELFKDEDYTVRRSAAIAIGNQSGLLETTTITALIELFKDEDYTVRCSAANAIGKQSGLLETTTMTALIELFKDEDYAVQCSAAKAIGNQSVLPETAATALVEYINNKESYIQSIAANALGKQSALSETTVAALVDLFKDKKSNVGRNPAKVVGDEAYLVDKILETSGFVIRLKSQTDYEIPIVRHLQHLGPLYSSLLCRGFREQFTLYNRKGILTVNQPSGIREVCLQNNGDLQDIIQTGRNGLEDADGYNLWGPLEDTPY